MIQSEDIKPTNEKEEDKIIQLSQFEEEIKVPANRKVDKKSSHSKLNKKYHTKMDESV